MKRIISKRNSRRSLARWSCALVAIATVAGVIHAQGTSRWKKLAPCPVPLQELLGASANGKMYVFAGVEGQGSPGVVWEYDPGTDAWTVKKPMPLPAHHVAFTEYQNKIYAFGGFKKYDGPLTGTGPIWEPIDNAWEYDPKTDTWKALAPMSGKRGSASAAAVDGKIYVVGGAALPSNSKSPAMIKGPGPNTTAQFSVGTVQEYDIATNTWRERTPMHIARNHFIVGAVNGKIYAIGGRVNTVFNTGANTDAVEEYDPVTDMWNSVKMKMPTPRSGMAGGVYNGRIFVAGGELEDTRMNASFRAVEAYDPARDEWTVMPPMLIARHGLAGAVVGDTLHMVGGAFASGSPGDSADHEALRLSDYK